MDGSPSPLPACFTFLLRSSPSTPGACVVESASEEMEGEEGEIHRSCTFQHYESVGCYFCVQQDDACVGGAARF